jgi:hypothetical protein
MKQVIYFLPIIILMGCSQPKPASDSSISQEAVSKAMSSDDSLKAIIDANINKQPVIDTVFLGFTFSMSKKQAIAHYAELIKQKKLIMNDQDQHYEYPMIFELAKAKAIIAPEFHNDKLYKISLLITSAEEVATEETVYLQVATTYMKKYSGFTLFKTSDALDPSEKELHWVKNNLHIYLHKTVDGSVVSYINLPADKLIDDNKAKEADSAQTQTKKDI